MNIDFDINSKDWKGIAKLVGMSTEDLEKKLDIKIPVLPPINSAEAHHQYLMLSCSRQPTEQIEATWEKISLDEIKKTSTITEIYEIFKTCRGQKVFKAGCEKCVNLSVNFEELIKLYCRYQTTFYLNYDIFKKLFDKLSTMIVTFKDFKDVSKLFKDTRDWRDESSSTAALNNLIVRLGAKLATNVEEIVLVDNFNALDENNTEVIDEYWAKLTLADLKKARTINQVRNVSRNPPYRLDEVKRKIKEKQDKLCLRAANKAIGFKQVLKVCKQFDGASESKRIAIDRLWMFATNLDEYKQIVEEFQYDKNSGINYIVDLAIKKWDESAMQRYDWASGLDEYLDIYNVSREGSEAKRAALEMIVHLYPEKTA